MWWFLLGTPRGSQKWDWAIPTHGNVRYGYYKNLVFRSKIEMWTNFLQRPVFGLRLDFTTRGICPDKMKPPPGQICQFHLPGFIMTSRVIYFDTNTETTETFLCNKNTYPSPPPTPAELGAIVLMGSCILPQIVFLLCNKDISVLKTKFLVFSN
jgi:hypothetical protein